MDYFTSSSSLNTTISRRGRRGLYLFLTLIPSALYIIPLLKGAIPWFMDSTMYFFPLRWHAAQLLHQGDLPLWNRCIMGGMPLFENPQAALAYPFHWPFLAWPGGFWFTFPMTFQLGLYGALTTWSLRKMGVSDWIAVWCGAIALAGGYGWSRLQYGNYMNVLPWWPLWLGSAFAFIQTQRSRWLGAGSTAVAMMMLSGAHQLAVYGFIGLALFSFVQALFAIRTPAGRPWVGFLAVTFILGTLMGAPGWLPQWFFIAETSRAGGGDITRVLQGAIGHAGSLLTAFLGDWPLVRSTPPPSIRGPWTDAESSAAVGLAVLILALIIPPGRNARVCWMGCMLVVVVAVALSLKTVVEAIFSIFPLAGVFHAPRRILGLAQWILILASGLAVSSVFEHLEHRSPAKVKRGRTLMWAGRLCWFFPAVLMLVLVAIILFLPQTALGLNLADINPGYKVVQVMVALACLVVCMVVPCRMKRMVGPLSLTCALVLVAHLTWVTVDMKSHRSRTLTHPEEPPLILQAGLQPGERFFTIDWKRDMSYDYTRPDLLDWMLPNLSMLYGLEDLGGYEPAQSERYRKFILELHENATPFSGKNWTRSGPDISPFFQHMGYIRRGMVTSGFNQANVSFALMPRWGIGTAFFHPLRREGVPYIIHPIDLERLEGEARGVMPFRSFGLQKPEGSFHISGSGADEDAGSVIRIDPDLDIRKMSSAHDLVIAEWPDVPRKPSPVEGRYDGLMVDFPEPFNDMRLVSRGWVSLDMDRPVDILDFYVWNEHLEKLWRPVAIEEVAALMEYVRNGHGSRLRGHSWIKSEGDNLAVIKRVIETNKLKIEVDVEGQPVVMTIADAWWPGWLTKLDGQVIRNDNTTKLGRAGFWRRIEVPPGRHTIEMIYFPTGVWSSIVMGLFSCFVLLVMCLIRHRTAKPEQKSIVYPPELGAT